MPGRRVRAQTRQAPRCLRPRHKRVQQTPPQDAQRIEHTRALSIRPTIHSAMPSTSGMQLLSVLRTGRADGALPRALVRIDSDRN